MLGDFLAFYRDVWRKMRRRAAVLILLTLISSILESLTIASLVPLFATIGVSAGAHSSHAITRVVQSALATIGTTLSPVTVGLVLLALLGATAATAILQARIAVRLQTEYVARWQRQLMENVMAARWSFLRTRTTGEVASAMSIDMNRVSGAFYQANMIVTSIVFTVVQITVALVVSPIVTIFLIVAAAVLFVVTRSLVRRAMRYGTEFSDASQKLVSQVNEAMRHAKFLKATNTARETQIIAGKSIDRIAYAQHVLYFDDNLVHTIFQYGSGMMVAILLVVGPTLLAVDIAEIIVVLALFVRLFPKVTVARQSIQSSSAVLPSFKAISALDASARACFEEVGLPQPRKANLAARIEFAGLVVIGDGGIRILTEIDLDVPAGAFVAIVGVSGAGKTTLIDVALGLVDPTAGVVRIDGEPLTPEWRAAWRRSIGYLGQDPVLFDGTIAENVRWGRPELSDQEIHEALIAAAARQLTEQNFGLNAPVGENGVLLSGGERQRVALARAIAGHPRLLVLDEATSSLDPETEATVIETLRRIRGRATILAVAHRLWSVRDADEIVVLEAGRIVERGTFADLSTGSGRFQSLWDHQAATVPNDKASSD